MAVVRPDNGNYHWDHVVGKELESGPGGVELLAWGYCCRSGLFLLCFVLFLYYSIAFLEFTLRKLNDAHRPNASTPSSNRLS